MLPIPVGFMNAEKHARDEDAILDRNVSVNITCKLYSLVVKQRENCSPNSSGDFTIDDMSEAILFSITQETRNIPDPTPMCCGPSM